MKVKVHRRNKYNATPTEYRGWRFDSKAEAEYARLLDTRKESGSVAYWLRQVAFDLTETDRYRADFLVVESDGTIFAVDVKGMETPRFKKTRKLWERYGCMPLLIVKKNTDTEKIVP
jgi:hypothetical protein